MSEKIRMTEQEYEDLRKILEDLYAEREENKKDISTARSFGDLSENSEYDEAKNTQAKLAQKIAEYEDKLRRAEIVHESEIDHSVVNIGSMVTVYNEKLGKEKVYHLVGSDSVDPKNGKISELSPIGRALIGNHVGDVVRAETPTGAQTLVIRAIERSK